MSSQQRQDRTHSQATTATLVLVRHGQSEWNRLNLFTGVKDPDLTDKGLIEARWAGRVMRDEKLVFDLAFTSNLRRAQHTLDIILSELDQSSLPITRAGELNERDYGALTGLDKDAAKKRFGDDMVHLWRRSYDVAPPGGESLKDTGARVMPYYTHDILPHVQAGKTVLVVAHGNSLRSLIMHLEQLSGDNIWKRELATAAPVVYRMTTSGEVIDHNDLVPSEGRDDGMG
jgi:2,3-bisphosphoglycerate-dependent phosphoglycerate mutase